MDTLSQEFAIKDLGPLHFFLGVEVIPTAQGLFFLSQWKYIVDQLKWASMDSAKPLPNPFSPYTKLSLKIMEPFKDTTIYRSIAGAIQYATVSSHELAFLVNKVCK